MSLEGNAKTLSTPPSMRFIRMGPGGAWFATAVDRGEVFFDHREVPHELALTGDEATIVRYLLALGRDARTATTVARRVLDFYSLGEDAVWVTFALGKMWWANAMTDVVWRETDELTSARFRKTIGPWRCDNIQGQPLFMATISSRLTKVNSTQNALCRLPDDAYAWRKINAVEEPKVEDARIARENALHVISALIEQLHWQDFETLIDILLARSGWHRVSGLGGVIKDADLEAEQAATQERALVQVKSSSDQKELDRYVEVFKANQAWSRLFFACHSPRGNLKCQTPGVMIWAQQHLADLVFRHGLFDWLVAKSG